MKTISFYGVSMLLLIATPYCVDAQNRNKTKTDSIAVAQRTQEIRDSLNVIMGKAKAGDADYKQAYEWWKQASLKQNVRAIANLGLCYQLGHGVERDSVDAVRLYVKSIKDGNSSLLRQRSENASNSPFDAMLSGQCFEKGIGVNKDLSKAARFYTLAANKGSVDGMRQTGKS